MPRITYATVYTEGLSDPDLNAAFERRLADLRGQAPRVCPHRVAGQALEQGERYERRDPSRPDRTVGLAHEGGAEVVSRAVEVAREAAPGWRRTPYQDRCDLLLRVAAVVTERRLELAALLALEVGKARADAFAEVDECVAIVELYARQMEENGGYAVEMLAPSAQVRANVTLLPYGVFGVIAPFNFPLAIPVGMAAAALVTGNTVVFKPSAVTPVSGDAFYEVFEQAGVPTGVLSLVHGGQQTGHALAQSAVDAISFTGSADVGIGIAHRLAAPPYLRPVFAEMGGKNAAIVTGSAADIDVAARAMARSAYGMSGQKCNAASRAIITDDVYDDFVERLCGYAGGLVVGDPMDAASFTGPVVSEVAHERFERAVAQARSDGRVMLGGGSSRESGHYVELTVVDGLPPAHRLTREELFLPLLSVVRVDDFDAALAEANAVRYGLSAGLFSDDETERARFLDEIQAGIAFVNTPTGATTGVWPGSQTMAGWKASGATGKGGFGPYYLQQFMREQSRTIAV